MLNEKQLTVQMFRSAITGIISLAGKYLLKTSELETASSNVGTLGFSIQMNLFPTYCTDCDDTNPWITEQKTSDIYCTGRSRFTPRLCS
jgi:hypothetical protein